MTAITDTPFTVKTGEEDLPPASVGDAGGECIGDSKDDYVFVNGSDAVSDDHVVVEGNGELYVSEPSVGFERNGKLDNMVEVNGIESDSSRENVNVVEEIKENGEIKSESEVMVVESGDGNGDGVWVRDSEVVEESDSKLAVDEVKEGASGVGKGDDSNASPSIDVVGDDETNVLPDLDSGSDVVQDATVQVEPQEPGGVIEELLLLEQSEKEVEDEVRELEVVEEDVDPHYVKVTESEPVDGTIAETEPREIDFEHLPASKEDTVVETQLPNGDVKASDNGAKELLLDDAVTEKQSADCELQDLQPVENKELDLVEAKAEVKEQGEFDTPGLCGSQDASFVDSEVAVCEQQTSEAKAEVKEQGDIDTPGLCGNQDPSSIDSVVAVCEQQPSDENKNKDHYASDLTAESEECLELQTVPEQSERVENQSNFELTASEMHGPVFDSSSQCNETAVESVPDVSGDLETSAVGSPADNHVVDYELDRVDREVRQELIAQAGESSESSVHEVSPQDRVAEETGLVDVIDEEVSLKDVSIEKTTTVEEAASLPKPESDNVAAKNEEGKDLDASHLGDGAPENEVTVPESSHDSGSCLMSENGELTAPFASEEELLVPGDPDVTKEHSISDDEAYTADESSSQPKLEKNNDTPLPLVNGTKLEVEPVNDEVDVASKCNCGSSETLKPKISFGTFESITPFSHSDSINIHTDILNRSTELVSRHSDFAGEETESANAVNNDVSFDGAVCPEQSNVDEVLASPVEASGADSADGQNVNPDLVRSPFYYLIRIPRFDDVKLSEQIRLCEKQLEEKTRIRDAARIEYQKRKAIYWEFKTNFGTARAEENAAYKLISAKKREIDSAMSLINLARHAITVDDVDSQILNMERRIQHETMNLAEEKRLIREIKQLKHQRDQLAADTERQREVQQALDRRVETEEQLKVLRKELDALRENHGRAEECFKAAKKKNDEESALLDSFKEKFIAADDIRQKAYVQLQTLKKQAFEKNKLFYHYKDDVKAANEYALAGKKESLEQHCVNQVEKFMDQWNKNEEFRKIYIRCNMRSTLRRLRTLDGRALGPDEEPPSLGNVPDNKVNIMAKISSVGTVPTVEGDSLLVARKDEEESSKKIIEQKNKTPLAKKRVEATFKNSLAEPSGRIEIEEKEKENKETKEEEELAMKAEQKRKEEAARLREQRRLDEKVKAQEALERKRRMAEKAQARAEFRSRKEAEEKEKEKEKRAKKKGKKKGLASETAEIEPAQLPESLSGTTREPEVTEKSVTRVKKSHKPALYTKQAKTTKLITSPPAPLRNRGKRRIPQWVWWLVLAILAVALIFPLGNIDILGFVKLLAPGSSHQ